METIPRLIWRSAKYLDVRTYAISDSHAGVLCRALGVELPAPGGVQPVRIEVYGHLFTATLKRVSVSPAQAADLKTARGWVWALFDPCAATDGAQARFGRAFKFHVIPANPGALQTKPIGGYVGKPSVADPTRSLDVWRRGIRRYVALYVLPEWPANVRAALLHGFVTRQALVSFCAANGVALFRTDYS